MARKKRVNQPPPENPPPTIAAGAGTASGEGAAAAVGASMAAATGMAAGSGYALSRSEKPKKPRRGNPRVRKQILSKIREKYPQRELYPPHGIPPGTTVAIVTRKISDKGEDSFSFRPSEDTVDKVLRALGYVPPGK
jgi:hypothetical protein